MSIEWVVLSSAGSLCVAAVALFITLFQGWFSLNRPEFTWNGWATVVGGVTFIYAITNFIQINTSPGSLNHLADLWQYTCLLLLLHCLSGFSFSYLGINSRLYHRVALVVHGVLLIIIWATPWVVGDRFISRSFSWIPSPFYEPTMGPLGPPILVYCGLWPLVILFFWARDTFSNRRDRMAMFLGFGVWTVLGVHDILTSLGMKSVQFLMEYGFLAFSAAIMHVTISKFHRIEMELFHEKERLNITLSSIREGLIATDVSGRITLMNQEAERLCGCISEAVIGRPLDEVIVIRSKSKESEIPGGGDEWSLDRFDQAILESKDQAKRYISGSISPIRGPKDDEAGQVFIFRDLTDYRQAEKKLKESEEKYRLLVEESFDAVLLHDGRRILFANRRAAEMFHLPVDLLIGSPLNKVITNEPAWSDFILPLANASTPRETEIRLSDGRLVPVEISARTIEIEGTSAIQTWIRDISERKQAEEILKTSEKRYRDIFDNISDFIYSHDMSGNILSINQAVCETLGFSSEELIGRPITVLIKSDYQNSFLETYLPAIKARGTDRGIMQIVGKNGQSHYLEYRNILVREDGGSFYVNGSGRDITDQILAQKEMRKLEARLIQSQKMEAVGTLASGIAHDFNNILQILTGFLELMKVKEDRRNTLRCAMEMESAIHRAAELIQSLLTFGRKVTPELKPIPLNEHVESTMNIMRRTIPKMIRIETYLSEDVGLILADPNQLETILMNLCTNARDAMPEGGRLVIETAPVKSEMGGQAVHPELIPGRYVRLTISDTGQGMEKATTERIFDPFFTTKELGQGTGLGLSTVYGMVKSHNGHITCYSEPGLGTRFEIYLPAAGSMDLIGDFSERTQPEDDSSPKGSETILLVDDEPAILEVGREILESSGYSVVAAENGEAALERFRFMSGRIDLVILDLGMPGMGGPQCFKALREINPDLKVIIASGYSKKVLGQFIQENKADEFVRKPYRLPNLLQTVRSVLDH